MCSCLVYHCILVLVVVTVRQTHGTCTQPLIHQLYLKKKQVRPNTGKARFKGKRCVRIENQLSFSCRQSRTICEYRKWSDDGIVVVININVLSSQVADIEEKLDILIKAYMQDRERFLALPLVPETNSHSINKSNASGAPPPPPPPTGGILTTSNTTVSAECKYRNV